MEGHKREIKDSRNKLDKTISKIAVATPGDKIKG